VKIPHIVGRAARRELAYPNSCDFLLRTICFSEMSLSPLLTTNSARWCDDPLSVSVHPLLPLDSSEQSASFFPLHGHRLTLRIAPFPFWRWTLHLQGEPLLILALSCLHPVKGYPPPHSPLLAGGWEYQILIYTTIHPCMSRSANDLPPRVGAYVKTEVFTSLFFFFFFC